MQGELSTQNVQKKGIVLSRTNFVESDDVDKTSWKEFGAWLQSERDKAGLTQEQVSKASGLNVKSISRIETGQGGIRRATVITIAEAINKTALYHRIDENEALRRAGFHAGRSDVPPEIAAIDFSGASPEHIKEIVSYIRYVLQKDKPEDENFSYAVEEGPRKQRQRKAG